jgi:hypothetical protein
LKSKAKTTKSKMAMSSSSASNHHITGEPSA